MSDIDDMFGSDSSDDEEFDPTNKGKNAGARGSGSDGGGSDGGGGDGGGVAEDSNALEDSDMDDIDATPAPPAAAAAEASGSDVESPSLLADVEQPGDDSVMGGTGLSDSEGEQDRANAAAAAAAAVDEDLFGSDSDSGGERGAEAGAAGGGGGGDDDEDDPFEDSDDEGQQGKGGGRGGKGGEEGKTLGRLSKGNKGKGKKRKAEDSDALDAEAGGSAKKKVKGKGKKGDKLNKKKGKKGKKGGKKGAEDGEDGEQQPKKSKKKKDKDGKKKKKKKKKKAAGGEGSDGEGDGGGGTSQLQDLGLLSSGDEDAGGDEDEDDDLEEVELSGSDLDLKPAEEGSPGDEKGSARGREVRTREDDDFIDDTEDNRDLLEEYNHDAPAPGSDSEAEEDNSADPREDMPTHESPMNAVLKSMKRRKAQDLSTSEREQIAQEFMFKINQAAEDDEEAVLAGRPALNKLKMLRVVKATLAKKELQETFLEFDLLGVVKRWLQPYSNGQLPNLTIRKEMLLMVLMLPVQVDHLKRSGIGKVVMGLLNCKQETTENKRVLRELVTRWNRPVYEKETNYRAMRSMHDEPEAMEVAPKRSGGGGGGGGQRRGMVGGMSQRDGASRDEAVGNILNERARGMDPTKSRIPFSNGYAFSKAPRSRVEGNGRPPPQQVDTSARTKLLKKMAVLSRPINKNA